MADWTWFAGEPKGSCPHCPEPLRRADILVEWRTRIYHVGCLLTLLTALAPADPYFHATASAERHPSLGP